MSQKRNDKGQFTSEDDEPDLRQVVLLFLAIVLIGMSVDAYLNGNAALAADLAEAAAEFAQASQPGMLLV